MVRQLTGVVFLLFATFLLIPLILLAQTESLDEQLASTRQLYFEEGPEVALPQFERILALYRETGDRQGEAITLGYIGNCYKRLADYPQALDHLNRALAMKQELGERLEEGKTLSHLGLVYWEMGDFKEAISYLTRSIAVSREVADQRLEGAALNNLSLVYDELGDYERSLEQYRRVLELYRGTGFARGESDTLTNIGGVHLMLGHYRKAIHYFQQSLAISERLGLKPSLSRDLGNLAWCYFALGQYAQAESTFEEALRIAQEAGLAKDVAEWRIGKGTVLFQQGNYNEALKEYRKALETHRQAGNSAELVEGLHRIGSVYALLGDIASTEKSYRESIKEARAIGYQRGIVISLIALGDQEWRRKEYEAASAFYGEALGLARSVDDSAHVTESLTQLSLTHRDQSRLEEAVREAGEALTLARQIDSPLAEAKASYALAEAERHRGNQESALKHYAAGENRLIPLGDPDLAWRLAYGRGLALEAVGNLEGAVEALEKAVTIIEDVRSQLREERFRAGYIEDKYQVYVDLVRLLLRQGQINEAFLFAERLRARSFLDLFNRVPSPARAEEFRQAETELRERIRQLHEVIEEETSQPRPEQRQQALQAFTTELASAQREYQNLLDDLRRTDPVYAEARTLSVPSAGEVQQKLPVGAALLEYVVGKESVTVFVLTPQAVHARSVPLRRVDLESKVELFRDLLLEVESEDWRGPATSLAGSLLEPVESAGWLEGIKRLYLVPHGILHYLPFGALPRASAAGRFLAEDYLLAYAPSATALFHRNGNGDQARNSLLALAPARSRLRFAPREARRIAQFFPEQSEVFIGRLATEDVFKKHADRFEVIHVATHGYFNKLNPLFSGLELEPSEGEDGRLEVHEILALRLNASLITLSACETALGRGYFAEVPAGDDFVGLTRAFLFAGSPSVLASLWEVNDRSTLDLMGSFYRHLKDTDKATALAAAQREMLGANGRYRHPYYWAPFVLVGAME